MMRVRAKGEEVRMASVALGKAALSLYLMLLGSSVLIQLCFEMDYGGKYIERERASR